MKTSSVIGLSAAVLGCIWAFAYLMARHSVACTVCWALLCLICVGGIIVLFGRARIDATATSEKNSSLHSSSGRPAVQLSSPLEINELRDVDGLKRWDFLYEDVELVLLGERAPLPWRSELLAFDSATCRLLWKLTPKQGAEKDWITNVWIHDGKLRVGAWSGYTYTLDRRTGDVLDCIFTK